MKGKVAAYMRYLTTAFVALTLGGGIAGAQPAPRKEPVHFSGPALAARVEAPPPGLRLGLARPREFALSALSESEKARLAVRGPRLRTGIHRDPAGLMQVGAWQTASDGTPLWRAALRSSGAAGLRVEFRNFSVGDGKVWLYDGSQIAGPYSGRGPFDDGHFWSASVASESVVLEYQPAGDAGSDPPFEVVNLVHQTRRAAAFADPQMPGDPPPDPADFCMLDPNCYPTWKPAMSMVGIVSLLDGGDEYLCSGSLVATRDNSMKPYFLTAGHCVSTEDVARTVEVFWKYQTSSCGGFAPVSRYVGEMSPVGSHLIGAGTIAEGDYSLLLLPSVPADVTFAGWDTGDPEVTASVAGIHHPAGSWKRISFGERAGDVDAQIVDDAGVLETAPAALYLQIQYDQGRTQPGSSGSPLFSSPGVVVGTLTWGLESDELSVCEIQPFYSGYGRFSNAYNNLQAYFEDWPAATVTPAPASLNFSVVNKATPAAQTVQLTTGTASKIAFQARPDASWIGVSATGGQISASAPVALKISVDTSKLSLPGQYSGTVSVLAGSAAPQFINVSVTVQTQQSSVLAVVTPAVVVASNGVWSFQMKLAETAGVSTTVTALKIGGTDYSGYITQWFGTNHLAANGTIQASLRASGVNGGPQYFEFWGVDDASGQTWYRVASATFQ